MDGPHRIRKTYVAWTAIGMVTIRHPLFAALGRNGIANQQRKKFVARTGTSNAPLMHEDNLVDQ